jgi:nicotinate phosphoribosyltransferase
MAYRIGQPAEAAIFTDLYQLTMLQAYWKYDLRHEAVFDLFIRRLKRRNYLIACGLETVLDYLEDLHFSETALAYLSTLGRFEEGFLDYLAAFRFTGEVRAMPEGTAFFAGEPVLTVRAAIDQAQLVETFLLNQITFQTGIATKAERVVRAADGRRVIDFGMRRMHGTDAALKAARAACIGGVAATSNVHAAMHLGLEPAGTMAHSYIEAHHDEFEAFERFANLYPGTTLLVDTYDTLTAVAAVIRLLEKLPAERRPAAIRLDSGDLVDLSQRARRLLDEAGFSGVKVIASGSLDEFEIRRLLREGAAIDAFGVGTRLGTIDDEPYLDSVYKLAEVAGEGRMKLSRDKETVPGRKQVYRFVEGGVAREDVITLEDEPYGGMPLLDTVMLEGKRMAPAPTLEQIQRRAKEQVAEMPGHLLALEPVSANYPVRVSDALRTSTEAVRKRLTSS